MIDAVMIAICLFAVLFSALCIREFLRDLKPDK